MAAAAPFELVPLLVIDVAAVPGESKSDFNLCHGSHRYVQIPCKLSTAAFGATFRDVRCHGERSPAEL